MKGFLAGLGVTPMALILFGSGLWLGHRLGSSSTWPIVLSLNVISVATPAVMIASTRRRTPQILVLAHLIAIVCSCLASQIALAFSAIHFRGPVVQLNVRD